MAEKHYSSPRVSNEYMDCSLPLTFDPYNVCSFRCQYCFAYYQKVANPSCKNQKFVLKTANIKRLIRVFKGRAKADWKWKYFIKDKFPFHIGGLADSFDNYEGKYMKCYPLIKALARLNYPTIFSTKGIIQAKGKYYKLFKKHRHQKNFAFQFSIVTNDDKMAEIVERGCPSVTDRFKAMRRLSKLGYWTILRLRPYIIGLTDVGIEDLIKRAAEAGARAVSMEFFCLERRIVGEGMRKRYDTISKAIGFDILNYYNRLSPSERGTYQRLNRDVKEKYVKQLWKLCKQYGLQFNTSDPDFKELNESGSCCGLPVEYKKGVSKELTWWSRGQLTYHLSKLRERYWKSNGEDKYLKFEDIVNSERAEWMSGMRTYVHSLKRWATRYDMKDLTYAQEFNQVWNNLRSPGNPYNYFFGKIKPAYVDKNQNIVYKYVPHKYEIEWAKEGIL